MTFSIFSASGHEKPHTVSWRFFHPIKHYWIELGEYGSVQQKLIEIGELPDPYVGLNEGKFSWIEDHNWEFEGLFFLNETEYNANFVDIEFGNIDTYAKVYVNEHFLFEASNYFRPYSQEIKKFLNLGENRVKIIFESPTNFHKEMWKKTAQKLPAPNDVGLVKIAPYTRKPQYQFGWDWSLRMNTIGFQAPVILKAYNQNRILGKEITTLSINETEAKMKFKLSSKRVSSEKLIWKSKLFGEKIINTSEDLFREETISNPKLWWPSGHGESFLYQDQWEICTESGEVIYIENIHFGIRKTRLIVEPDQWGTSYIIEVNGKSIFCKGGDYIPQDAIPERITDESIVRMLTDMKESNFNMVRVWGGGYYQPEIFYETCDKLGLMVWQDFMFACSIYPGDSSFLENVKNELIYQIPRISSHPCLALFCGNNEVNVAWKYWGFQITHLIMPSEQKIIEQSYLDLFQKLIPNEVLSFTNTPYIHTSPLSHWGQDEFYNHGSQHYWGVWHGKEPMNNFAKHIGRFNSEYGFQSFPELSTINTFANENDLSLESDVMKHHQKSYVGNGMILKHATDLYGKPKSFEEFVYFSQLTQAHAVSMAVSGHRVDNPRCWGTLFWQVNDCWQAPSWSSIDYFGNWKALQYRVRDDYKSSTVLDHLDSDGKNHFYFVSDTYEKFETVLKCDVYDVNGQILVRESEVLKIENMVKSKIQFKGLDLKEKEPIFIKFTWTNNLGNQEIRTFVKSSDNKLKKQKQGVQIRLFDVNEFAKTAKIEIVNQKLVQDFWIYSSKLGVRFSTNFESFLPGTHVINITFSELPSQSDFDFQFR